ncbi:MAG: hypothetical protein ABI858_06360 [Pseudoxanthomonas sp.]
MNPLHALRRPGKRFWLDNSTRQVFDNSASEPQADADSFAGSRLNRLTFDKTTGNNDRSIN